MGDFYVVFLGIFLEGAPYIFIGTLISGFIDAYLPANAMDRILPKGRFRAIFLCGVLGLIFPVCECAIVPVIRRLVQKGLPVSCAITYMLSAPIVNPIVMYSTFSAFSGTGTQPAIYMMLSRVGIAYIVAVFIGLIVQRFSNKDVLRKNVLDSIEEKKDSHSHDHDDDHGHDHKEDHDHDHKHEPEGGSKLVHAMRTAQRDLLDTGMYFTIGVLITALYRARIPKEVIDSFAGNDFVAVPLMMALAFILSLCSTSDAFIASQALFSAAARQSFLVFGPMMDVKLVFMYAIVFRPRFLIFLALALFFGIAAICMMWGASPWTPAGLSAPGLAN